MLYFIHHRSPCLCGGWAIPGMSGHDGLARLPPRASTLTWWSFADHEVALRARLCSEVPESRSTVAESSESRNTLLNSTAMHAGYGRRTHMRRRVCRSVTGTSNGLPGEAPSFLQLPVAEEPRVRSGGVVVVTTSNRSVGRTPGPGLAFGKHRPPNPLFEPLQGTFRRAASHPSGRPSHMRRPRLTAPGEEHAGACRVDRLGRDRDG